MRRVPPHPSPYAHAMHSFDTEIVSHLVIQHSLITHFEIPLLSFKSIRSQWEWGVAVVAQSKQPAMIQFHGIYHISASLSQLYICSLLRLPNCLRVLHLREPQVGVGRGEGDATIQRIPQVCIVTRSRVTGSLFTAKFIIQFSLKKNTQSCYQIELSKPQGYFRNLFVTRLVRSWIAS